MPNTSLTPTLKDEARRLGFQLAGVCPAVAPQGMPRFFEWLQAGYAGQMHYLPERSDAYGHPRHVLDGARSLVMLAMRYSGAPAREAEPGQGRVARYAWGTTDYHDLIRARLNDLAAFLQREQPAAHVRGVVDTAPLLEREFAQLAGLGWVGKNTLLLNKQHGSWFFLAALLTDLELDYDEPAATDHCGTCRACLDACPTDAFPQPYVLDATRCISYLTIELRGQIPHEQREGIGQWLFGCDVCQDVCPWNHHQHETDEDAFLPTAALNPADAASLLMLDEAQFRQRFRHTPLWRAKRRGLLRNAAITLGNRPSPQGLTALLRGLNDPEPLVRGASAWALSRHGEPQAREALQTASNRETDEEVLAEIRAALEAIE